MDASEGLAITLNVGTFSALSAGNALSGNFVGEFTISGLSGKLYFEADLVNVRASLALAPSDTHTPPSVGFFKQILMKTR